MTDIFGCTKNSGDIPGNIKALYPDLSPATPLVCINGVVTTLITLAFEFLGAVCLLMLLYGAIRFIISGGDPKAVKAAKDTMTYAVIGTVLVLLVYVIAYYIANAFVPGGAKTLFDFHIGNP